MNLRKGTTAETVLLLKPKFLSYSDTSCEPYCGWKDNLKLRAIGRSSLVDDLQSDQMADKLESKVILT